MLLLLLLVLGYEGVRLDPMVSGPRETVAYETVKAGAAGIAADAFADTLEKVI